MSDSIQTMSALLGPPLGVAFAVGLAWLMLFGLRRSIGWAPLTAAIVALHAWAVIEHALIDVVPGWPVSSSWLVLTGWPLIALVVHVREGAHRARQLAIAVMVGLGAVTAVVAALGPDTLDLLIRGLSRGVLAFLAAAMAVVSWELLGHRRVPVPIRLVGALLLSLAFDAAAQGGFEALLAEAPLDGYVLGALTIAAITCALHGALGVLWLLVIEGERWTSPPSERTVLHVLLVILGMRRYEPMRPHVVRDAVSGLYDRTFVEDRAPVELERAAHLAASVAVLVIDARDDPSRVGRAFLSSTRLTDLACRWGPERYVALLPGADPDAARVTASRVVDEFRGEAAVGIAVYPVDAPDLERLVDRARRRSKPIERS